MTTDRQERSQAVWDLVIADMKARDEFGRAKYLTPLQINNGRDALQDAYEEALDLCAYLRQEIEERKLLALRAATPDPAARITVLEGALRTVRQGYCDILERRQLSSEQWGQRDGYGGRYGALTRDEIEGVIAGIDSSLNHATNGKDRARVPEPLQSANAPAPQPANESRAEHPNIENAVGVWAKRGDGLGWTWLGVCPNRRVIEIVDGKFHLADRGWVNERPGRRVIEVVDGKFHLDASVLAEAFGKSYFLQSANALLPQPANESPEEHQQKEGTQSA